MIIGRIGCFLTGIYEETYGIPTDSVFGMHLGDQYLRHPVALYEIGFLIALLDSFEIYSETKEVFLRASISDLYAELFYIQILFRLY